MDKVLREAGEDYLEVILILENDSLDVRSVDVARIMEVSRPSVNKAVGILREMGMVEQQPYGSIRLTDKGRVRANAIAKRHKVLKFFLIEILGVDPTVADGDACKMEHIVSGETMEKLNAYLESITENNVIQEWTADAKIKDM